MSKRKRPPRSSRSRINQARPPGQNARSSAAPKAPGGRGLWLYGIHAVTAALENPARKRHRLLLTKQAEEAVAEFLGDAALAAMNAAIVERAEIDAVCGPDAVHQGIALLTDPLADVAIEDVIADSPKSASEGDEDTLLILDQATDPRNIGAVLRSARAFGARAVIVQDRNAPPETGTMAKAASGALEHVALVRVTNLARCIWTLKDAGYWCLGLDGHADEDIDRIDPTQKRVLVLGAEGSGLRRLTRETCDQLVKIPISPDAESLNLSNAAAVALFAVTRRR